MRPCCGGSRFLYYLELLVAVHEQHVHRLQLRHVSVPLELLPYLGADGGDGHVERVHGLDLGSLWIVLANGFDTA